MRVRRRNPCLLEIDDALVPDLAALLRGQARLDSEVVIALLCPVSGDRLPLSADEARFIAGLSARTWHDLDDVAATHGLSADAIAAMARRGVVCSDADDDAATHLREAETQLASIGWHPHVAVYHALSRWHAVEGDEGARDHGDPAHLQRLRAHAAIHGDVPPHFHVRDDAVDHISLPLEPLDDDFARVLRARRTTRHFRGDVSLPLVDFTRVVYGTFGAIGTEVLAPQMVAIKRTSASGGALHPIEAYPLVIDVDGLPPGFYHYQSDRHAMALLEPMSHEQARELAAALTIGQTYFAEAHALVFHVARLDRHHWKYRRHPKAYKAVLLDSGHLSQTFYLLAAERGLGAFYTAAINDADVSERLRLDPLREIVIGANGVGVLDPSRNSMQLNPDPYDPVTGPGVLARQPLSP